MRKDLPSHLFGDECHVIAKMADLSQLEQQWAQVKDCVHRLQMDLIPWRKLVDVQEELQNRFDQLKATAEEQFGLAKRSAEEQEDIREYLIVLKVRHCAERYVHLAVFGNTVRVCGFASYTGKMHLPCQELSIILSFTDPLDVEHMSISSKPY